MENLLTLAITLYELTDLEIKNWLYVAEKASQIDGIHILFINDNPNKEHEYSSIFSKYDYTFAGENLGKFEAVKTAADNNLIKGKWVKFCDPDDIVISKKLDVFVRRLSVLKTTPIVKLQFSRIIFPGDWDASEEEHIVSLSNLRRMTSLVNENTILPTEDIINFDLHAKNQTKSSDVLFSLASNINKDREIVSFNKPFYVYNLHKGISNESTLAPRIRNVKKIKPVIELFSFFDIIERYNHLNTLTTPSFYDYKWLNNTLLNHKVSLIKRIHYTKKAYKKLKIIARANDSWKMKWNFANKIKYVYIFNLFRRRI